jgi:hypothetical protein
MNYSKALRKEVRESFSLSYQQMATITNTSINAINAMENRGSALSAIDDEFYQQYFIYVKEFGKPEIGNLSEMHLLLSSKALKLMARRRRKAENLLYKLECKHEVLQVKYRRALIALRAFDIFENVVVKGSPNLLQNIKLARRLFLEKNQDKLFKSLLLTTIQLHWSRGELNAIHELENFNLQQ